MDKTESLKAQLAAANGEIEDLRLRLQNLVLLYRHESETKKKTVHRAAHTPLAKKPSTIPTSKAYPV